MLCKILFNFIVLRKQNNTLLCVKSIAHQYRTRVSFVSWDTFTVPIKFTKDRLIQL